MARKKVPGVESLIGAPKYRSEVAQWLVPEELGLKINPLTGPSHERCSIKDLLRVAGPRIAGVEICRSGWLGLFWGADFFFFFSPQTAFPRFHK